jgi:hypothetical protein
MPAMMSANSTQESLFTANLFPYLPTLSFDTREERPLGSLAAVA